MDGGVMVTKIRGTGTNEFSDITTDDITASGDVSATDISATDITVSGDITTNKAYFSCYQTTGVVTLGTSYTKMNIGTQRSNSGDFTFDTGNSRVTVNKTGTFMVAYSISTDCTSGSARTESQAVLYENGTEIAGTFVGMYNRLAGQGLSNGAMTMVMDITSGDYFEIFALKTGSDTVQQTPNGTNLTFIEL